MERVHLKVQEEYRPLIHDILKFLMILVVLNLIMFLYKPIDNTFMGGGYIKLMIGLLLGVVTYWLIIDYLIAFD
jgi:hypothetical protein